MYCMYVDGFCFGHQCFFPRTHLASKPETCWIAGHFPQYWTRSIWLNVNCPAVFCVLPCFQLEEEAGRTMARVALDLEQGILRDQRDGQSDNGALCSALGREAALQSQLRDSEQQCARLVREVCAPLVSLPSCCWVTSSRF